MSNPASRLSAQCEARLNEAFYAERMRSFTIVKGCLAGVGLAAMGLMCLPGAPWLLLAAGGSACALGLARGLGEFVNERNLKKMQDDVSTPDLLNNLAIRRVWLGRKGMGARMWATGLAGVALAFAASLPLVAAMPLAGGAMAVHALGTEALVWGGLATFLESMRQFVGGGARSAKKLEEVTRQVLADDALPRSGDEPGPGFGASAGPSFNAAATATPEPVLETERAVAVTKPLQFKKPAAGGMGPA